MAQIGDRYENVRDYTVNCYHNPNVIPCPWTYPARTVFEISNIDNLRGRITLADYNRNEFDVDVPVFSAHFSPTPLTISAIIRGLGILLLPDPDDREEEDRTFIPDNSKNANDINEECYFCGGQTEPLFGNQRICRSCNK